ncbi:carboxylesterase family protein [Pseudarthrobacter psychrotolerans]|uniref:Carboxylic ester hydrolase n=1 Tax=Pseudarthrobacter psychrotolerans TaxID=2697569 RepID=A0A6P1NGL2_9MICC|nr:carboxylesterase family protein [Pseudarthrobacter psychrotolerans]QHK18488.1 carboxylesterase family protein [Pseudarthrobacter psychrotolerans]
MKYFKGLTISTLLLVMEVSMESIVSTAAGQVRGLDVGPAVAYLGIPYGAPTSGDNRFRAPQPVTPWAGVRDATVFGPAAPQQTPHAASRAMMLEHGVPEVVQGFSSLLYPHSGSPVQGTFIDEDCLMLNVWAPAGKASGALPVMVWLHGGAFVHGAGSEPAFNGDRLADQGDVVVVTVNHRLGVLGFLPYSGPDFPDAGQAGMLDIVAALKWVKLNIGQFGGDPANVTVFGQSGGGMKISALMAMPQADGLFHKAIIQSGAGLQLLEQDSAELLFAALLTELKVETEGSAVVGGSIEKLKQVPVEALLAAQAVAMARTPEVGFGFAPVIDGTTIVGHPLQGVGSSASEVPLLIGCTSEEFGLFLAMDPGYVSVDEASLAARLEQGYGDLAEELLVSYMAAFPDADAKEILRRMETDRHIRVSNRQFVELKHQNSTAPVYGYLFDYPTGVLHGQLGAAHSVDLAFVFGNQDRIPLSGVLEGRDEIAHQMVSAWTSFAHSGMPSSEALPVWPEHNPATVDTMVFGWPESVVVQDPDGDRLKVMEKLASGLFPRKP